MSIGPKHIVMGERGERGVVAAEFIVVMPILLLFLFLTADLGWLLKNWLVVTNAARESTRCAIVDNCMYKGEVDPIDPRILACGRIWEGGLPWDKDGSGGRWPLDAEPDVSLTWVDLDQSGGLNAGDSAVLFIEAESNWITPVIPFLGFISGGGGSVLPDTMTLHAREEMLIEFLGDLTEDNFNGELPEGSCDLD
jgi:TadE-like protein